MRSFLRARQTILFLFLFACAALFSIRAAVRTPETVPASADPPAVRLMIDPGHGGEDGGASEEGVVEKDLNLAVARDVAELCDLFGLPCALTRTDDRMVYDAFHDLGDYTGQKKVYDLRNRIRLTKESGAEFLLSIHMNRFPDPSVRGMQLYYADAEGSDRAAERIRAYAAAYLDPERRRENKRAGDAVYLLDRSPVPAVLAECGFLSNPEERAALLSPAYRARLAAVLFAASAEYLSGN